MVTQGGSSRVAAPSRLGGVLGAQAGLVKGAFTNPAPPGASGNPFDHVLSVAAAIKNEITRKPGGGSGGGSVAAPSIVSQAASAANRQIADQVAAYQLQQKFANDQAVQRAGAVNSASLAAAHFLSGLGDQTRQDYKAAVGDVAGLASGYSGQLRNDVQEQVAGLQASLDSVPGSDQRVVTNTDSLANLLYGLGGSIPGQALETQGLGAYAAARALPSNIIAYGREQGLGVLGQGKTSADQIQQQIQQVQAQAPSLTRQFMTQYQQAADSKATGDRADRALRNSESAAKKNADLQQSRFDFDQAKYAIDNGWDPKTGKPLPDDQKPFAMRQAIAELNIKQQNATTAYNNSLKSSLHNTQPGDIVIDGDGRVVYTAPTATQDLSKLRSKATALVTTMGHQGYQLVTGGNATFPPGTPGSNWVNDPNESPTPYWNAVAQIVAMGPQTQGWAKTARNLVNQGSAYAPGSNGRPYEGKQAASMALVLAQQGLEKGKSAEEAFQNGIDLGLFPPAVLRNAIIKVYGGTKSAGGTGGGGTNDVDLSSYPEWARKRIQQMMAGVWAGG